MMGGNVVTSAPAQLTVSPPAVVCGTGGVDQFYVRLSDDAALVQVWNGPSASGNPSYSYDASTVGSLVFNTGGNDTIYLDSSNGFSIDSDRLGFVDLMNNWLVVLGGSLPAVNALVASGYNGGSWNGIGIITSSYHPTQNDGNDKAPWTTLGVAQVGSDVVVKYTYQGDVDLNGVVNAADFAQIKYGSLNQINGTISGRALAYSDGDVDYNGVINAADFAMAKSASLNQGAALGVVFGAETQGAQSTESEAAGGGTDVLVMRAAAANVFAAGAALRDEANPLLAGVEDVLG